jgi:hypothetical protein
MSGNILKNSESGKACGLQEKPTISDKLGSILQTQDYDLDMLNTICSKLGVDYSVPPMPETDGFGINGMVESIQVRAVIFDSVLRGILAEL